jgi:hypothetical protein
MPWLHGVLASIGFFLISIFGGQPTPVVQPITQATHFPAQNVQSASTSSALSPTQLTQVASECNAGVGATQQSEAAPAIYTWQSLSEFRLQNAGDYTYCEENGVIYVEAGPYSTVQFTPLTPAPDVATFMVASDGTLTFGKDAHTVYEGGDVLQGADPSTFQILDNPFEKDANHIYNAGTPIFPNADPATFSIVTHSDTDAVGYEKDKNNVYAYTDGIVTGADPATFDVLMDYNADTGEISYVKDAKNVYQVTSPDEGGLDDQGYPFSSNVVASVDAITFQVGPEDYYQTIWYAKDKNHVYSIGPGATITPNSNGTVTLPIIPGADPNTFVTIYSGGEVTYYEKDSSSVYYDGSKILGADPSTFVINAPGLNISSNACDSGTETGQLSYDASDKNHQYCGGKVVH